MMHCSRTKLVANGFTLAELLIALTILAVIATFAIPKILQVQQNQQRNAILKETVSTLSHVTYQGVLSGTLLGHNFNTIMADQLNAVKICPTNSETEGCWNAPPIASTAYRTDQPGFVLANGLAAASYTLFRGAGEYNTRVILDWNGVNSPNTIGDDQLVVLICTGPVICTVDGNYKIGEIQTVWNAGAVNRNLFEVVFK